MREGGRSVLGASIREIKLNREIREGQLRSQHELLSQAMLRVQPAPGLGID